MKFDSVNIDLVCTALLHAHTNSLVRLRTLDLSDNMFCDEGAVIVAEKLLLGDAVGGITTLRMNGCKIGNLGAEALSKALRLNSSLHTLSLERNIIDPAGAAVLASVLRENASLRALHLNMNYIGIAGTEALCAALRLDAAGLSRLHLRGCFINTDATTTGNVKTKAAAAQLYNAQTGTRAVADLLRSGVSRLVELDLRFV